MTGFDVVTLPDDWETLADAGRTAAQDMDSGRFLLGDLALRIEKRYGQDSIGQYSADIGLARAGTLREYARVARRFDIPTRIAFAGDAGLNWSHFREALRAKDDAEIWLARAADEGWPVAEMARQISAALGKPVPPRKLAEFEAVVIAAAAGTLTLGLAADCGLGEGQRITVKVYEAQQEVQA